jgi:uncharacterized membrane protein
MVPGVLIYILVGVSVFMVIIGMPMALGKIPPNDWYGVRLPVTMRSKGAWDAANIQYGWWAVLSGVLSLPVLILGLFWGSSTFLITLYLITMLGPLIGGIVPCMFAAYRAEAREKDADATEKPASSDEHDEIPSQFR